MRVKNFQWTSLLWPVGLVRSLQRGLASLWLSSFRHPPSSFLEPIGPHDPLAAYPHRPCSPGALPRKLNSLYELPIRLPNQPGCWIIPYCCPKRELYWRLLVINVFQHYAVTPGRQERQSSDLQKKEIRHKQDPPSKVALLATSKIPALHIENRSYFQTTRFSLKN